MKREDFGFSLDELKTLKKLSTPSKIQDFLNSLTINFEEKGDSCMSPRQVLREKKAHCIEGALLAAVALRLQGHRPLIVDMMASRDDDDHVIAVFKKENRWGAITKSNHASLRYREPVYRDIRELVLSFFHEYFLNSNGKKTLRSFSQPVDLRRFDKQGWMTFEDNVWFIPEYLTQIRHEKILTPNLVRGLRKVDPIELKTGEIVDYHRV